MQSSQTSSVAAPERNAPAMKSRHSAGAPARLPELLAPAGDWECARAAVENGADAIYFGLEKFNARMRANNFTEADLPKLMEFLHRRGVKGYVTFNMLVFENEMAEAEQYVRAMIAAGVDAAVVQDVGICRLIRQHLARFPDSRLDADDHHQRRRRGVCARTGLQPRRARPRMFAQGNRSASSPPSSPAINYRLSAIHFLWRSSSTARCASLTPANA